MKSRIVINNKKKLLFKTLGRSYLFKVKGGSVTATCVGSSSAKEDSQELANTIKELLNWYRSKGIRPNG